MNLIIKVIKNKHPLINKNNNNNNKNKINS